MYAWASVLNAIMAFGMETTFFRFINKKEDKEKVYNNTFLVIAFIVLLFVITTFLFIRPIAEWMQVGKETSLNDYISFVRYFILILSFDALCVIPFARIRAEGRPVRYAFVKTVNILSFIGLNLFFLFFVPIVIKNDWPLATWFASWYQPKWIGYVFWANLFSSILTFLQLMPELLKLRFKLEKKLLLDMFHYSWPVLIANLSFIINENSDKIFLEKLLPASTSIKQVGIYGACAKLAVFMNIFIQAFRLGAEPFFFSSAKNKEAKETYSLIMSYFIIALVIIYVALIANIEILKYFIGESFWEGLYVVPILLLGYLNLGIYMNLSIWYKLSDQTKYGLYISGIGAVLTIVLNIIFIPMYGFLASAWVSFSAYTVMMITSYFWGQKYYPIPYRIKIDLLYIVVAAILVYVSFVLLNRNIIYGNLLLLIFAAFILYIEGENLRKIFLKK